MTGRCEVEGTCGISDKFTGSAIDLTYEVCTGSYSVGGGVIVVNTVYSGTLLNSGGTYAGNTGTAISSVL
ncbi:MAG: hypothetical protein Q8O99_04965 [bacterium]|nr:hypothetical protein [bacterium]